MSLFTKSMTDVEISDVASFCNEGIEEGIRVEYKEDWTDNKKLAREIASFANTYGGLLLIGIDEKDRKPVIPLMGVDFEPGIEEKITSITFKGINPPVFPEIKICQIKDNPRKAVIVIRVHESNDTPHRVEQDTKVYIRVSSQKEPVLAPFEEIEWLMHRRKKALDNSDRILLRASKRFYEKYKKTGPGPQPGQNQVGIGAYSSLLPIEYKLPPTRGILVIPLYPHQEIIRYLDLKRTIDQSATSHFPNYRSPRNDISMQESMLYSKDDKSVCHTEINSFGLIFHKEDFSLDEKNSQNDKSIIDIDLTVSMIYWVLFFAARFYEKSGFWGAVRINAMFDQIKGRKLSFGDFTKEYFAKNEFDNEIAIERKTTVFDLTDNVDEMVIDMSKEYLWSFGAGRHAESGNLKAVLDRVKYI